MNNNAQKEFEEEEVLQKGDSKARQIALLEENIAIIEDELHKKYYQLGKGFYEFADSRVIEINKLVDNLVEAKQKLSESKGMTVCEYCLFQNPEENQYCGHCGMKIMKGRE